MTLRCQAEAYCKAFNEQRSNCHQYCIGYVQLQNIYTLSHMPKRYQFDNPLTAGADKENFIQLRDWKDSIMQHVQNGDGLFLYSENKGNGKTSWASKMLNEYFKNVALKNNLRCRGLFVEVPKFFKMLRDNMNNPSPEVAELCKNIETADLVVWDDIGAETPSKWVREQFYIYINHRYSNLKSQIFTSNLPPEILEQEDSLGGRIMSRVKGASMTLEFVGHDRRSEQ